MAGAEKSGEIKTRCAESKVEHFMVEGMKQAGLDPALIYAFEKTGLLVSEANQHLIADVDLAKWNAAMEEYYAEHGQSKPPA